MWCIIHHPLLHGCLSTPTPSGPIAPSSAPTAPSYPSAPLSPFVCPRSSVPARLAPFIWSRSFAPTNPPARLFYLYIKICLILFG